MSLYAFFMFFYVFLTFLPIYNNWTQEQMATFKVYSEFYVSATGNIQLKIINENTLCTFTTAKHALDIYDHYFGLSSYYDHHYVDAQCNKTIWISKGHTVKIYNDNSNTMTINCENLVEKLIFKSIDSSILV